MRLPVLCLLTLLLSGCAAAAVVSAIPGVLVDRAVGFFNGQESSLPVNMQHALAAVQKGLGRMSLHVDVLEPVPEGYALEFGNGELDGDIRLQRQTQQLT
ncbi:MAG: SH3 domain-containing protein, partial [Mariprofundaceae bacterium]|nr:SH3 domain-containing protein [Mariprofundaceae bacterium]